MPNVRHGGDTGALVWAGTAADNTDETGVVSTAHWVEVGVAVFLLAMLWLWVAGGVP